MHEKIDFLFLIKTLMYTDLEAGQKPDSYDRRIDVCLIVMIFALIMLRVALGLTCV